MIFVFGSNEAGRHGAGAALVAKNKYGAINGKGFGLMGQSFAIPTKDKNINVIGLGMIRNYVNLFISYAEEHKELEFQVTQIGCGLAGYKPYQIAPLFEDAPDNCHFDEAWKPWLGENRKYWGTG